MLGSNSSPRTERARAYGCANQNLRRAASELAAQTQWERPGSTQSHAKTDDAIALPALSKPERYSDHNGRKGTAGGERELATANWNGSVYT